MPGSIVYKDEGNSINYTFHTSNIENDTLLYYDIVSDAPQDPSAYVNTSSASINESETVSFSGTVINIQNNSNLYYEISGTVNASDFSDNTLTGITTVSNGTYVITKSLAAFDTDLPEETQENFQLTLRLGDNTGTIVGTSSTVYVNNIGFTSFTFSSGGTLGQYGPILQGLKSYYGTSTYPWLNSTTYFNATGGIQIWTVPRTGTYRIVAAGAKGGDGGAAGGLGAIMQGDFNLTLNQKIKILVGQRGNTDFSYFYGGSGGGGTFVVNNTVGIASTSDILVIAGGGGGHGENSGNTPGLANATISDPAVGGATGGNGNGGGGFLTDGGNSQIYGKSFLNGGTGGSGANNNGFDGSFGGGGASSSANGGGYSGGYGGSSINNGSNQSNSVGNTGHGYVVITAL
jgi:hypothetical protein